MSPTVGSTLFSFTDEWRGGSLDLTGLLERIALDDLGPDVELVGYQSFRGLPSPSAAEIDRFREDVERLRLRPTAFGVYVDRARRPGRWPSVEEIVMEVTAQLRTARRLGFVSARAPLGMDLNVLDRLLPLLDELGLVLTFEIQGPHTPDAPDVVSLVDWLEANSGAPAGITLDTSLAMPDLPVTYRRVLLELGMTPMLEEQLDDAWRASGPAFPRLAALSAAADEVPTPDALRELLLTAFIRFGHGDLDDWRHVLPWTRHAHAKFWDWDEAEVNVLAPHRRFVDMLVGAGYRGSISSEFGGIARLEREAIDVIGLTQRHVSFLRTTVSDALLAARTGAVTC